jgi:hypothetical protein
MLKRYSMALSVLFAAILAVTYGAALASTHPDAPECPPAAVASCETAGPQAPRDIDEKAGENPVTFAPAPPAAEMKLCDIHFHRSAEHRAKAFHEAAEDGNGWVCTESMAKPGMEGHMEGHEEKGCEGIGDGDTIEVHWVYTTCDVGPAPCLASCFSAACQNPQLRVEAQVFTLGHHGEKWFKAGYDKAPPPPGDAVQYLGSTTGGAYNPEDACSPFQVTWNVRRDCRPLALRGLDKWCEHNEYGEDHAHSVRDLVTDPGLLSEIP